MALENFTPVCKVNYKMVGQDGNAFNLIGRLCAPGST